MSDVDTASGQTRIQFERAETQLLPMSATDRKPRVRNAISLPWNGTAERAETKIALFQCEADIGKCDIGSNRLAMLQTDARTERALEQQRVGAGGCDDRRNEARSDHGQIGLRHHERGAGQGHVAQSDLTRGFDRSHTFNFERGMIDRQPVGAEMTASREACACREVHGMQVGCAFPPRHAPIPRPVATIGTRGELHVECHGLGRIQTIAAGKARLRQAARQRRAARGRVIHDASIESTVRLPLCKHGEQVTQARQRECGDDRVDPAGWRKRDRDRLFCVTVQADDAGSPSRVEAQLHPVIVEPARHGERAATTADMSIRQRKGGAAQADIRPGVLSHRNSIHREVRSATLRADIGPDALKNECGVFKATQIQLEALGRADDGPRANKGDAGQPAQPAPRAATGLSRGIRRSTDSGRHDRR